MLARNAQRLPDWLGLVVTSRPEFDVKTPLQALNPFPLDTQSESNRADIRDYLRRELATQLQNRPDADRLVEQILEKSEGVFLYVERFCDDVQHGHLSLDRPEQFPQGLGGIFCQYFQRQFPDLEKFRKDVRPALRAILAAREPLPVEILQRLFNWQDEELRDFTRPLASLLPVAKENGCEVIKPYHKSLADWLANDGSAGAFYVSTGEGNKLLGEFCWHEHSRGVAAMALYAVRYALFHLYVSGMANELAALSNDRALLHRRLTLGLKRVYLSCSSQDLRLGRRLRDDLMCLGFQVVLWENFPASAASLDAIVSAKVSQVDVVLALLSPRSVRQGGFCESEWASALTQGVQVLPVMVEECLPPSMIARLQWLDMRGWESSEARFQEQRVALLKALSFRPEA